MSGLNRLPLNVGQAGIVWVKVVDADGEPVTDLAADDAGISSVLASVVDGPASYDTDGPYAIDLESSDHGLIVEFSATGRYGVPFPATLDDGALAVPAAACEIAVDFQFTGARAGCIGFASRAVIDPSDPFGNATPQVNLVQVKGQPVNDLVEGAVDVSVSHVTDEAAQALTDLNQLYDISLETNVSPPVLTKTRRSDGAVVGTWNVTLEDRLSITEMTEPA